MRGECATPTDRGLKLELVDVTFMLTYVQTCLEPRLVSDSCKICKILA